MRISYKINAIAPAVLCYIVCYYSKIMPVYIIIEPTNIHFHINFYK